MKRYCIGLFSIVFVAITIVPAFFYYAMNNMNDTDIFTRPGWLYSLTLVAGLVTAYICEKRMEKKHKKIIG